MQTALETLYLLPRVDNIMSSVSLLSKRTDLRSLSKYDHTANNNMISNNNLIFMNELKTQ